MLALNIEYSVTEKGKKAPEYRVGADLNGELTMQEFLQLMKRTLILVAADVLKEEQARGFDKEPLFIVDNNPGKKVADVSPLGKIEIVSRQQAATFIMEIYESIIKRSPVDTGLYIENHFLYYNGAIIGNTRQEIEAWIAKKPVFKSGDIIRFINVMPYAGKLERLGRTSTKGNTTKYGLGKKRGNTVSILRVPNGTYVLAARSVTRKYKFNSSIRFEWINGSGIDLRDAPTVTKRGKPLRRTFSSRKGSYVYPSIVIRINEQGIK